MTQNKNDEMKILSRMYNLIIEELPLTYTFSFIINLGNLSIKRLIFNFYQFFVISVKGYKISKI